MAANRSNQAAKNFPVGSPAFFLRRPATGDGMTTCQNDIDANDTHTNDAHTNDTDKRENVR